MPNPKKKDFFYKLPAGITPLPDLLFSVDSVDNTADRGHHGMHSQFCEAADFLLSANGSAGSVAFALLYDSCGISAADLLLAPIGSVSDKQDSILA